MSPVQLEKGLADESSLLMIPTMVDILPQGYGHQMQNPDPECICFSSFSVQAAGSMLQRIQSNAQCRPSGSALQQRGSCNLQA